MKKLTTFYLSTLAISILAISCNNRNESKEKLTTVKLQQQWMANSGFAGEIIAQEETDTSNSFKILVEPGSDQIDTKQIVMAGQADFGVAGAEQVLQAVQKGADLVIIGVINYKSLACFISKKNKQILTARDMQGHKIGTMEGTPVDMIYQALKIKEKLQIPVSDEVPTGWVTTGFIRDQYDVYPAFINDEPITLKMQGIEVNTILPNYYDINFIGTVYFCKRELIEKKPDVVQKFINAVASGWEKAIKDPAYAIKLLKKYDKDIDENKELQSLIAGRDYYKGENEKVLYATEETWKKMVEVLKSIKQLDTFNYEKSVENKFVGWYLSNEKSHSK